jgi:hypothetical protein
VNATSSAPGEERAHGVDIAQRLHRRRRRGAGERQRDDGVVGERREGGGRGAKRA